MKIRNGLVSNSSCSSFIVHYRGHFFNGQNGETKLDKQTVKFLKRIGYKFCDLSHPINLMTQSKDSLISEKDAQSLAKNIICNQNDEIYILLKNNIPFIASTHYGHETVIYPKNSKYFYVFHNIGFFAETYHQKDSSKKLNDLMKSVNKNPSCEKILVSKFIKNEEKFMKKEKGK